jgi:hypothetical protein
MDVEFMKTLNPLWRQPTPKMQLTAILMGLEGNVSNAAAGVITPQQLEEKIAPFIKMIKDLGEWLPENF